MKIEDLYGSVDSICLHSAILLTYFVEDNNVKFRFVLSGYHYSINELDFDNKNDILILDLILKDVSDFVKLDDIYFEIQDSEVIDCYVKNHTFYLDMLDLENIFCQTKLKFKDFEWFLLGKFSYNEYSFYYDGLRTNSYLKIWDIFAK